MCVLTALYSALYFPFVQVLQQIGIREATLPALWLHLAAHDHVPQCGYIGPAGLFTFANENLIAKAIGKVLARRYLNHPDRLSLHFARVEGHQCTRRQTFRNMLLQLVQVVIVLHPYRVSFVINPDN